MHSRRERPDRAGDDYNGFYDDPPRGVNRDADIDEFGRSRVKRDHNDFREEGEYTHDEYGSPPRNDRPRPSDAGPPTDTVIIEGLPSDVAAIEVRTLLV